MYIYLITNLINGKIYIGQHAKDNLDWYWRENVKSALRGSNKKRLLYRAIRKYGPDNFHIIPWSNPESKQQMDLLEQFFIKTLRCRDKDIGYNITEGGGGTLGYRHTEEAKRKMSGYKHSLGHSRSQETRKKIAIAKTGTKLSEETKNKISKKAKGRIKPPVSAVTREKLRILKINYWKQKHGV